MCIRAVTEGTPAPKLHLTLLSAGMGRQRSPLATHGPTEAGWWLEPEGSGASQASVWLGKHCH